MGCKRHNDTHVFIEFYIRRDHYSVSLPVLCPTRGGHVTVYVHDMNQASVPTPSYSVFVCITVLMALSTVFNP